MALLDVRVDQLMVEDLENDEEVLSFNFSDKEEATKKKSKAKKARCWCGCGETVEYQKAMRAKLMRTKRTKLFTTRLRLLTGLTTI